MCNTVATFSRNGNISVTDVCLLSLSSLLDTITIKGGVHVVYEQEVKVIWQKVPHGGPIPRLGVTPGGQKLYHWIPGVGFPISVP